MPTTTRRKRAADAAATDVVDGDTAVAAAAAADQANGLLPVGTAIDDKHDDNNIDEAEAALAAAKEVRKAKSKAKRRRLEARNQLRRFEILIEQGLMPLVISLLSDSPRDLLTLYCTSKRSQPYITREVVVRASVYQGNNSREIMRDLVRRIEKRSIFLPSAVRMLR